MLTSLLNHRNWMPLHRVLIKAYGLEAAAILSDICARHDHAEIKGDITEAGFFVYPVAEMADNIGLSKDRQAAPLARLADAGLIEQRLVGAPAKRHFRLAETFESAIAALFAEQGKPAPRKADPKSDEPKQPTEIGESIDVWKRSRVTYYTHHKQEFEERINLPPKEVKALQRIVTEVKNRTAIKAAKKPTEVTRAELIRSLDILLEKAARLDEWYMSSFLPSNLSGRLPQILDDILKKKSATNNQPKTNLPNYGELDTRFNAGS